jgi:hypothetical protein
MIRRHKILTALAALVLVLAGLGVYRYVSEPIGVRMCVHPTYDANGFPTLGEFAHFYPCPVSMRIRAIF